MGLFSRRTTIELGKFKCPHCKREFEDPKHAYVVGKPCRECTRLISDISQLQRNLLTEELTTEQKDQQIAKQINDLLLKESQEINERDEESLRSLTEKLFEDEKRRKKIVKEIMKLQRKKR